MNQYHGRPAVSITLFSIHWSYEFAISLWFALFGIALMLPAAPAHAQNEINRQIYAIPAGTLKSVLVSFGQMSGVMISYTESEIADKRSSGVNGSFTVPEALNVLLAGTGLEASKRVEGGFTLRPQAPAITGQTLPLMTVSATADTLKQGTAEEGYRVSNISGAGPWGERSLQDTPYSMSIVPSDLIQNAFITDMDQIAKVNPVVQLNRSSGHDDTQFPVIRGFSNFALIMDGMRLSAPVQGISLEEVERVGVLSGTSGFLYGSGNVGGVVNYVLKRPTAERLTRLTLGNYGGEQYFGHLDLGGPIDARGAFRYRLNAVYQDGDTSVRDQKRKKSLISGAIDWNVTHNFLLQLEGSRRTNRTNSTTMAFRFSGIGRLPKAFDSRESYTPKWNNVDSETDRASLKASWRINDIFGLRTAYMYKRHEFSLTTTFADINPDGITYEAWSREYTAPNERINHGVYAYLDADFHIGPIGHKVTLGASGDIYDHYQSETDQAANWDNPPLVTLDELKHKILMKPDWDLFPGKERYKSARTTSRNIMIGDNIIINKQWSILGGVNYTTLGSFRYAVDGNRTSKYEKSAWTPTASLIYKPLESLTTYATYMEALQNGVIVGNNFTNAGEVLPPLVSNQYEVGAKYDWNNRFLLTSALFRIERANQYSDNAQPLPTYVQDGLQVHQGVELTLTGKVTNNLTLMGGGTLMDPKVKKSNNSALEGKKSVNVAPVSAKIYAEYAIPSLEGLVLTGGVYYTGERYADAANTTKASDYTLFDVGGRYTTRMLNNLLVLRFNVANLTNKNYWIAESITGATLGIPRTFSFSASMTF